MMIFSQCVCSCRLQLLEFLQRYITDVLTEARVYSEHASKTAVDLDDVRLAVQAKVNFSFTQPPPREVGARGPSAST